ncbi:hypothetical protein FGO68_gene5222 [Halteria grandinella]|uniref:Uncharacterized protein n=1 Tax=Halteria grandinella TaxID=5974 RepID=A0A8J8SZR4_HALGN|nr:hypothetical protein FGO68_gene5222 [Halteria grandinella]
MAPSQPILQSSRSWESQSFWQNLQSDIQGTELTMLVVPQETTPRRMAMASRILFIRELIYYKIEKNIDQYLILIAELLSIQADIVCLQTYFNEKFAFKDGQGIFSSTHHTQNCTPHQYSQMRHSMLSSFGSSPQRKQSEQDRHSQWGLQLPGLKHLLYDLHHRGLRTFKRPCLYRWQSNHSQAWILSSCCTFPSN